MNKEYIKTKLHEHWDLNEISNNHLDLKNIESSSYVTRLWFYVDRFLDLLEETEKKGNIQIDDEKSSEILINAMGPNCATSLEGAIKAAEDYNKRLSAAISETVNPVKKSVDKVSRWTKIGVFVSGIGVFASIVLGLLSLVLPHKWDLEASKEPIKVQIIQQTVPQSQSEPITPESSTVVVPTETL